MEVPVDVESVCRRVAGHGWTILPWAGAMVRSPSSPPSRRWSATVESPAQGGARLTGAYRRRPRSRTLVVLVHGLGGCHESPYVIDAARAVERRGWSSLRVSMRGAAHDGEDLYHGGLGSDIRAVVEDEIFERYSRIFVLGFSLGGHLALRAATGPLDDRVRAVAAVGSPVDLGDAQSWIDAPARFVYRRYILSALVDAYRPVARRGRAPTSIERVARARTLREWDRKTVVPRYGFASVDDYYQRASVAGRLGELDRPGLLLLAAGDPMVPAGRVTGAIPDGVGALTTVVAQRGGHVFFPGTLDLGFGDRLGAVPQVLGWFDRVGS